MHHAPVRRLCVAFVVAVSALGCDGGPITRPIVVARDFTLVTVGGEPLPYYEQATTAGDTLAVVAEVITLRSDSTASRRTTWRRVVAGGAAKDSTGQVRLVYHVSGSQIRIDDLPGCLTRGGCMLERIGTLGVGQLILLSDDPYYPGRDWLYQGSMPPD
jgi:hypothetical protein